VCSAGHMGLGHFYLAMPYGVLLEVDCENAWFQTPSLLGYEFQMPKGGHVL
jgi:hypothetical protein